MKFEVIDKTEELAPALGVQIVVRFSNDSGAWKTADRCSNGVPRTSRRRRRLKRWNAMRRAGVGARDAVGRRRTKRQAAVLNAEIRRFCARARNYRYREERRNKLARAHRKPGGISTFMSNTQRQLHEFSQLHRTKGRLNNRRRKHNRPVPIFAAARFEYLGPPDDNPVLAKFVAAAY